MMNFLISFALVANVSFFSNPSKAQETSTVVVESTRLNENEIEPSRSTYVLTEDQIKNRKADSVADLLRAVPGVEVVRNGGLGQTTSIFIRGARSEDTLVLIDGIEVNDAMSPSCGYDFSYLPPTNIERIEVFEGPQSVRFGAGALGGVINIITKVGSGEPKISYLLEGGSYQTLNTVVGSSGNVGSAKYSLSVNRMKTDGFSAADQAYGNTEADGAEIKSASGKVSVEVGAQTTLETTLNYTDAAVNIDRTGGPGGDDPNDLTEARQIVGGLTGFKRFTSGRLRSTLGAYYSEIKRTGQNSPDPASTTSSQDFFLSENKKIESNHEFTIDDRSTLRLGLQTRSESGAASSVDRHDQSVTGAGLTYLYDGDFLFFDAGVREDTSTQAGGIFSDRASVGVKYSAIGSKAFVTYGTGFKLPSLYQLYSSYGTTSLRQEMSETTEATIDHKFNELLGAKLVYFANHYRDMIDFNTATGRYFNLSTAKSTGLQAQTTFSFGELFNFKVGYTYMETEDSAGLRLIRRPRNAWLAEAQTRVEKISLTAQYIFRGERDDTDPGTFTRRTNDAYDVMNLEGSYQIANSLKAIARIENLFNRSYQEALGYGTPRLSGYVGLTGELP